MSRGQLRPDRGRGTSLVDSGKRRQEAQRSTGGSTPRVFYNGNRGSVAGAECATGRTVTETGEVGRARRPEPGDQAPQQDFGSYSD